jgi:hypothetical protein
MRTSDGIELMARADDPVNVVNELRACSRRPGRSRAEFMQLAAGRASLATGKPVRSDSAEHFVADLLAAGLLLDETETETRGDPHDEE